jgi:hypothetical protein
VTRWFDIRWLAISALLAAVVIGAIFNINWRIRQEHLGVYTQGEAQSIIIESRMPY